MDDTPVALPEAPAIDATAPAAAEFRVLRVARIEPSPTNPRRTFEEAEQRELTESVRLHGVLQPILVRPHPSRQDAWQLVAGERRWRAAQAAELREIPAMVRALSDEEVLELQLVENLKRADLHPLEEAEGYERLLATRRYDVESMAARLGKSRAYVYGRMKLLALCDAARKAFYAGKLLPSTALLLARIPVEKLQRQALREITEGWQDGMPYRQAADHIQRRYMLRLVDASFPRHDAGLVPEAGACGACPKRTGNQPELFADVDSTDVCTDPSCYDAKRTAHVARLKAQAEQSGQKVLTGKQAASARSSNDYVALDDADWSLTGTGKKLKSLLGRDAPAPTLVEDHHGNLVPMLPKKAALEALKGKGHAVRESGRSEAEREKDRKAQAERVYRERLFAALIPQVSARQHYDLQPIVAATWNRMLHDTKMRWLKLKGWSATEVDGRVDAMDQEQRYYLLIEWSLAGELQVSDYALSSKPKRMLALAQALEVDAGEIRRAVLDEQRAKAKKPAAKKAAATKKPAGETKPRGRATKRAKAETTASSSETPVPSAEPATEPATEHAFAVGDVVRVRSREHLVGRTPHYLARLPGLRGTVRQTFPDGRLHIQFGPEHQHKRLWMRAGELELHPPAAEATSEAAA